MLLCELECSRSLCGVGHVLPCFRHLGRLCGSLERLLVVPPDLDESIRLELALELPNELGHDVATYWAALGGERSMDISPVVEGLDVGIVLGAWSPPCEILADHPLVECLSETAQAVLGRPVALDSFPGGTDAPHFQLTAGIPAVPSFGPGLLAAAHGPNESVSTEAIVQVAKMYARTARSYFGG